MDNIAELSQQDIDALFDTKGEELASHSSEFTFIQLRMSTERFVVPLCGLSIERALMTCPPKTIPDRFISNELASSLTLIFDFLALWSIILICVDEYSISF
ncbi:hypothetical protein ACFLUZ_00265 [Chloroflexota bacterium]